MLNFFKRGKDKAQEEELIPWGTPVKRKMSKEEVARDEQEQRLVEEKNKERRDVYRIPGVERIFSDNEGRRLAIRFEDNSGPNINHEHPPFSVVIFWGTRELGHINAKMSDNGQLHLTKYVVENGYEGRGLAAEMLAETENQARTKNLRQISGNVTDNPEWTTAFQQKGFAQQGSEITKSL